MERRPYPSDLTNQEWQIISSHLSLTPKGPGGRPRKYQIREIINAIMYLTKTGCQWRMLPNDFPPWKSVYGCFAKWRTNGFWSELNSNLREECRVQAGRDPEPTAAIVDSQSVKTTEEITDRQGYDAGKKIKGRKRHIMVDVMGLLLCVVVHSAGVQDRDGAKLVFIRFFQHFSNITINWADGGYAGKLVDWVQYVCRLTLEIIKRPANMEGFKVLPRRWVVERTFAWLGRYRRLSKDYERLTETSECLIYVAMVRLMTRRLAINSS